MEEVEILILKEKLCNFEMIKNRRKESAHEPKKDSLTISLE